jgi:hypothetical protein
MPVWVFNNGVLFNFLQLGIEYSAAAECSHKILCGESLQGNRGGGAAKRGMFV